MSLVQPHSAGARIVGLPHLSMMPLRVANRAGTSQPAQRRTQKARFLCTHYGPDIWGTISQPHAGRRRSEAILRHLLTQGARALKNSTFDMMVEYAKSDLKSGELLQKSGETSGPAARGAPAASCITHGQTCMLQMPCLARVASSQPLPATSPGCRESATSPAAFCLRAEGGHSRPRR